MWKGEFKGRLIITRNKKFRNATVSGFAEVAAGLWDYSTADLVARGEESKRG